MYVEILTTIRYLADYGPYCSASLARSQTYARTTNLARRKTSVPVLLALNTLSSSHSLNTPMEIFRHLLQMIIPDLFLIHLGRMSTPNSMATTGIMATFQEARAEQINLWIWIVWIVAGQSPPLLQVPTKRRNMSLLAVRYRAVNSSEQVHWDPSIQGPSSIK